MRVLDPPAPGLGQAGDGLARLVLCADGAWSGTLLLTVVVAGRAAGRWVAAGATAEGNLVGGRHLRKSTLRRRLPYLGASLAVLLIVVAIAARPWLGEHGPLPRLGGPRCGARVALRVATDPGMVALLGELAGDYANGGPGTGGRCVDPVVTSMEPAAAVDALAKGWQGVAGPPPDVWLPASSAWAGLLDARRNGLLPVERPKVATSPLVLAMPRPMAERLGWPARPVGWADLLRAVRDPAGWGAFDRPRWGPVLVGKPDPARSTVGMHASIATVLALAGDGGRVGPGPASGQRVAATVLAIERAPGRSAPAATSLLAALQRADDRGEALGYLSVLPVEEKAVIDYNQGNPSGNPETLGRHRKPRVPLVAIYPKEGTLESDHPFLLLRAPWVTAEERAAAADFLRYLRSDPIQARLLAAGYRTFQGAAGPLAIPANGLGPGQPRVLPVPAPQVVKLVTASWEKVRKRGNVLAAIDVSGSMQALVPGTASTKLDLVKQATVALSLFADDDRLGLWQFSSRQDGARDWRALVPLGRVGDPVGRVPRRQAVAAAIQTMRPAGRTGLYDTTLAAVEEVRRHWEAGRINAVVLLTDGRNEKQGGLDLPALLDRLRAGDPRRPVRVITIGYGPDADFAALRQIAQATKGSWHESADPREIQRIFIKAITTF